MKGNVTKARKERDTMRAEYDFSGGVRGKYFRAYQEGTNIVVLEPDVAARFKSSKAVNEALRALLRAVKLVSTSAGGSHTVLAPVLASKE
jgi:hypothetical protein